MNTLSAVNILLRRGYDLKDFQLVISKENTFIEAFDLFFNVQNAGEKDLDIRARRICGDYSVKDIAPEGVIIYNEDFIRNTSFRVDAVFLVNGKYVSFIRNTTM